MGVPSAINASMLFAAPLGGGSGGIGVPSATNVSFGGGNGGIGVPSATNVPFGGGKGGIGVPSARKLRTFVPCFVTFAK